jgi:hypothetical protein
MNKRIKVIAEQAGFVFPTIGEAYAQGLIDDAVEELVKLIINECIDIIDISTGKIYPEVLIDLFKKHFGVK